MPDITIKQVSQIISRGGGPWDFTVPGLTNIKAYIVYATPVNDANLDGVVAGTTIGVGLGIPGGLAADCVGVSMGAKDASATSSSGRAQNPGNPVYLISPTSTSAVGIQFGRANITNGLRLNETFWSTVTISPLMVTVVFFAGTDVQATTKVSQGAGSSSGNRTITGIGFEPNVVFATSIGSSSLGSSTDGVLSSGVAVNRSAGWSSACLSVSDDSGVSTTFTMASLHDNAFAVQGNVTSRGFNWKASAFSSASDTFTYTMNGTAVNDYIHYLFLRLNVDDPDDIFLGTPSMPAVTGVWDFNDIGWQPQAVIAHEGDRVLTLNSDDVSNPFGFGILCADTDNVVSHYGGDQNGQATSVVNSGATTVKWLTRASGVAVSMETDAKPVFDSGGWTANIVTTQGYSNKMWVFAVRDYNAAASKIFLGNTNVGKIYKGTTPVTKVFKGTTQVFG